MLTKAVCKNIRRCFSLSSTSSGQHDGRVAVLTASTSGIALHAAKRLGKEGAKIVISSRREENVAKALEELKEDGIEAFGKVCHVSDEAQRKSLMKETAEKFGGIDYLFSNAAVNPQVKNFLSTPEGVFDKVYDVNVKSTFLIVQDAIPYMKNRPNASIILHASITAYRPDVYPGAYSASKTALLGLMHAFSPELGQYNIRINTIAPNSVRTKFGSAITENPKLWNHVEKRTPMKRPATLGEVSGVISFLFSDRASYVSSECIPIAGGGWLR